MRLAVSGEAKTPNVHFFDQEIVEKCHECSADVVWQPLVAIHNGDAKLIDVKVG
jgi:hypothetical protein